MYVHVVSVCLLGVCDSIIICILLCCGGYVAMWQVYEYLAQEMPSKVDERIHAEVGRACYDYIIGVRVSVRVSDLPPPWPVCLCQISAAGDMKGRVIATNTQNNDLCRMTMEIFAGVRFIIGYQ
jgi:hypothetical protein